MILLVGHLINWKWSCKEGLRWQLHNALRQVVWTPANKWRIYPKGVWHDPVPSGSHHNKTFRQTCEVRILKCQVFYYFITDNIFSQILWLLMNGHQWRKMFFAARWCSYDIYHQGLTRPCEHVRLLIWPNLDWEFRICCLTNIHTHTHICFCFLLLFFCHMLIRSLNLFTIPIPTHFILKYYIIWEHHCIIHLILVQLIFKILKASDQ